MIHDCIVISIFRDLTYFLNEIKIESWGDSIKMTDQITTKNGLIQQGKKFY